jgi:putative transcriptional regulator
LNVPIIVKLDDKLHDRRMTLTELSERIGITLANLSILKTGKARAIRFSTLEAICEALQCQPGDLLEFASGSKADGGDAAAALGHESETAL